MKNFEFAPPPVEKYKDSGIDDVESKITPEQQEILESATKFAEYLTGRWPQVDTSNLDLSSDAPESVPLEPKINYYISGSLATMLLSRSEKFSEIIEDDVPTTAESNTRDIPESARNILASFARQIGDLDFVQTNHYKNNATRLRKGGGGPSFDEVPGEGSKVLRRGQNQIKLMCDPVESYGSNKIAKVTVEGRDYYIARPDTIIAYKVLHLLQSYEQKPEKFNTDFGKLLGALKEVYSDEELEQVILQVLSDYENHMRASHERYNSESEKPTDYEMKIPKFIERILSNQQISPEIRAIIESLRK
jgi:hypothetical protein